LTKKINQNRLYLTTKSKKNKKILSPFPAAIYAIPAKKIHPIFRTKTGDPGFYREASFFSEAQIERKGDYGQ
jgi:hypothetical protein